MFSKLKAIRQQIMESFSGRSIESRTEKRMLPRLTTRCYVRQEQGHTANVNILNISPNGMAFSDDGLAFQPGEIVRIVFHNGSSGEIVCEGQVVSQVTFQPAFEVSDSKNAIPSGARISVRFQKEIESPILENLTSSPAGADRSINHGFLNMAG